MKCHLKTNITVRAQCGAGYVAHERLHFYYALYTLPRRYGNERIACKECVKTDF